MLLQSSSQGDLPDTNLPRLWSTKSIGATIQIGISQGYANTKKKDTVFSCVINKSGICDGKICENEAFESELASWIDQLGQG